MPQHLYAIGGQQRLVRPLITTERHWYEYQKGLILRVNTTTNTVERCLEYVSPPEVCEAEKPAILFKCGTLEGDRMYVCTQTEVLTYAIPSFEQVGYISLPCFNDVHHVRPTPEGNLVVAIAGLDLVIEITPSGDIIREWDVLGHEPWTRFSRDIDYRKVNTKPHTSHPNYVFYIDNELWVTRNQQRDAVRLTGTQQRIPLDIQLVHDGVLHEGLLYFTAVNGFVIIVDAQTLKTIEVIDLNSIHDHGGILGWCRGILIEDGKAWIGFSRIRATKIRENVGWAMHGFKRVEPTRIACYDLSTKRCLQEINLEDHDLGAVFSIFPAS